jgi:sugar/nucleoside kinase (ribokinase family)
LFRGVTVKVNRQEADEACARAVGRVDYGALRELIGAPRLFVTDGPAGVAIAGAGGVTRVAARRIEKPVDICGAGDSFSAGAACALAIGASDEEAAGFGNLVASVTIMKAGTGTASPEELRNL